ncbi:beta-glucosidase [Bacteroidia bacterium]|nr:beta-glucosidase [Bacteroidia bacterium]
MKNVLYLFLLCFFTATVSVAQTKSIYKKTWIDFNKNGKMDVYEDPQAALNNRVEDLLAQMNLDEKTCQLATLYGSGRVLKDSLPTPLWKNEIWKDGIANIDEQANGLGGFGRRLAFPWSVSIGNRQTIQRWFVEQTRLGIPVDFTNEGIRGLCHYRATMMPAQCGQGATWNRSLIAEIARVTAEEANALGYTNIYSPILDIAQDPRWGRVVESYGEDPFLAGELGVQQVRTLQAHNLVSSPKHFAVYSVPVGGRDEGTRTDPHVAPREMRALYLEPFRKAFVDGHALGVMSSYNDYDGIPVTGSPYFLTEILRHQFGFKGYVVSDSEAVEFIQTKHRTAETAADAAAQAINAGLNVRTQFDDPQNFILPLRQAIAENKITLETIDSRVRDVLRVKFQMGLFDNPYKGDTNTVDKIVHSAEHQAVSMQAALQSFVLLKNESPLNPSPLNPPHSSLNPPHGGLPTSPVGRAGEGLLPLSKNLKKVAVIGPNADEVRNLTCRYGPSGVQIQTIYKGIKEYLPTADVQYAKGCEIIDKYFPESELYNVPLDADERARIDSAVALAKNSEIAILVLGGNEKTVREEFSRTNLDLIGRQQQLLEAVYATGTPVVLLLIDGRAATINWAQKHIPAIVHGWFPGEFMGSAAAQVLWGDYNPGGKLAVTFPKSVGQIPFAFPFKPGSDTKGRVRVDGTLYPFGYGLSYTTFEISDLQLGKTTIRPDENIQVTVKVKNTGSRAGDEVMQLYVRDNVSSVTTYDKQLRGFERVSLQPNETKMVTFTLTPQHLGLWNRDNQFVVEPGTFTVFVGNSSKDEAVQTEFAVK